MNKTPHFTIKNRQKGKNLYLLFQLFAKIDAYFLFLQKITQNEPLEPDLYRPR